MNITNKLMLNSETINRKSASQLCFSSSVSKSSTTLAHRGRHFRSVLSSYHFNKIILRYSSTIRDLCQNRPTYSKILFTGLTYPNDWILKFNLYLKAFGHAYKPITTRSQIVGSAVESCFGYILFYVLMDSEFLSSVYSRNFKLSLPDNLFFILNKFCRIVNSNPLNKYSPTTYGIVRSNKDFDSLLFSLFGGNFLKVWSDILIGTVFQNIIYNNVELKQFLELLRLKILQLQKLDFSSIEFQNFVNSFYSTLGSYLIKAPTIVTSTLSADTVFLGLHKFSGSATNTSHFYLHFSALDSFKSESTETSLIIMLRLFSPRFYICSDSDFVNDKIVGGGYIMPGQYLIDVSTKSLPEIYSAYFSIGIDLDSLNDRRQEQPILADNISVSNHKFSKRNVQALPQATDITKRAYSTLRSIPNVVDGFNFIVKFPLNFSTCVVLSNGTFHVYNEVNGPP